MSTVGLSITGLCEINEAYEQIIGIKRADIEGRRAQKCFLTSGNMRLII